MQSMPADDDVTLAAQSEARDPAAAIFWRFLRFGALA
jgi:hypothetical protein